MNRAFDLRAACAEAIDRRRDLGWAVADRAAGALAAAGEPTGVPGTWSTRFELDDTETRLLEVAAAVDDPALYLCLGLLSGDEGPARPTVAIALELVGAAPAAPASLARFGPLAPLQRYRLIRVDGGAALGARRLVVPDRVAAQLRGDDLPDPAVLDLLIDSTPMRLDGTDRVASALQRGEQVVWIHGPVRSAAVAMATGACRILGVPYVVADLRRLPAQPRASDESDRPSELMPDPAIVSDAVTRLVDEATLTGSLLVLAGADLATAELGTLTRAALPVIAIGTRAWDPAWNGTMPTTVTAPRLTLAQRQALWEDLLPDHDVPREAVALRLTPEQIHQVAIAAGAAATEDGLEQPELAHLRAAARRFCRGQHATETGVTIDDLVLPPHVRREVVRLLDWTRYRDEVAELGPLHGKGKGTGICALFAGSPGTGKTLAAHVVADALGMDLMQVDLSSVLSKYIGESERNLERLFTDAEATNAVLFFDEADALFGARSEVRDAHDRYANQEISYLLQRMESFDGVTILATNLRGNLDPAFARRLHFVITFPDPDAATRTDLWRHLLSAAGDMDPADPIDPVALGAAVELCGGDIRNVVLAAVYDAVARAEPVGLRHVAVALSREFVKLGRRMPNERWLSDAAMPVGRLAGSATG